MDMIGEIEAADLRRDFAITRKTIYMNNGAVAPTPLSTIKAVTNFLLKVSEDGPDSSGIEDHLVSLLSEVRTRIAHLINCDKDEVVLTESTTQGLNIVAKGIAWNKGDSLVVRGGKHEHYANYLPWLATAQSRGLSLRELAVDRNGFFEFGELEKALRGSRLITMSHVLYNTGSIMPVEEVGKIAAEHDVLLCIDAAQSAGALPIDVKKIGCQFMAFPGFKWICGPLGIGVLYCSKKAAELLEPQVVGGESAVLSENNVLANLEMPSRLQAGFRNYPGAAGLESALRYILRIGLTNIWERNLRIANLMREELGRIEGIELYGPDEEQRRSSIVSFLPPKAMDAEKVVKKLEESSVIFAARDIGGGRKAVRASPHFFNDETEATTAIGYVRRMLS
ncbi:MAG TPA: aminotransferase class V-fold PLP-dependent enzyme [Nitrososphaera sp.]|nr:aminotransferase class V-fold PLP-dependent enzyme [Nitrososphaera sp.]